MLKFVRKKIDIFIQWWVVFGIMFIFSLSATISSFSNKANINNVIKWNISIILPFLILSILTFIGYCKRIKWCELKKKLFNNKFIIVVLVINVIIRIYQLDIFPRWDTEAYLYALIGGCKKFSFTVPSYLDSFRLCSHSSLGYALFLATGEYMISNSMLGVSLVNLLLVEFAIYFVYIIIKKAFPLYNDGVIAIATLLVSVEPMFLGTFYNISLDFGVAIFLIYLMYFALKKYHVLFLFFSLIIVQTKETGVIVLFGFLVGYAIMLIINGHGNLINRILDLFLNKVLIGAFFGCLLMIYYKIWMNLSVNANMWGGGISSENGNKANNYIGIDLSYIIQKLKTFLFINYYWLALIIIVFIIVFKIYKKQLKTEYLKSNPEIVAGAVSAVFLAGFNCLYVTYNNPRYNILISLYLSFVLAICILGIYSELKKIARCLIVSICIIFIVQSYTTIDFMSFVFFDTIYTSDTTKMVHTGWNGLVSLVADISLYNNQNRYLDIAFDKILKKENYNQYTDVLLLGTYENNSKFESMRAAYFEGKFFEFKWDTKKKRRVYIENKSCIPLNIIYSNEFEKALAQSSLNESAILMITKQFYNHEDDIIKYVKNYYTVGSRQKVSINGQGTIYYYKLSKRV